MKSLHLIVFIILCKSITAQTHNFNINEDKHIYYQKISTTQDTLSIKKIQDFLNKKSCINAIKTTDSTINFKISNLKIDYKKYGGKYMNTLILLNQSMSANAKIEVKPNKYRLTIKNIHFVDDSSLYAKNTANQQHNTTTLEAFVLKNRKPEFRSSKTITQGLSYMDQYFTDFFTYKTTKPTDW